MEGRCEGVLAISRRIGRAQSRLPVFANNKVHLHTLLR